MTSDIPQIAAREAACRLIQFCEQWSTMRHAGDEIHGLQFGGDKSASLTVTDILAVAQYLRNQDNG
ncbi:hypothetical protein [Sphingobium sp. BS19]|uniref:hypothetical protein n=1 Tax=Sphingobium sp. BS19 TaxID=3018973 RepID=UPI0022EE2E2F|nr:hypothetical protein [Sphingobium sp. BS19]GLI99096.1 hypothetical protein Sbs19_29140 [Sphingobium sp. BS19]